MTTLYLLPLDISDLLGGAIIIVLACLCFSLSWRLMKQDPENGLWLFLGWFTLSLLAFAILHSLVLALPHLFDFFGEIGAWRATESYFGGIDTIIFVIIASVTLFFYNIQRLYRRMMADHHQLEETSQEILALNREMEALVMERTMSEMALGMAHGIRNPLHVIGGFSHRLLKKTDEADPTRAWAVAIAEEARRIEQMVERFETLAQRKTSFFAQEDLNVIAQTTVDLIRPELRAKNINLVTEIYPAPLVGRLNKHLLKVALSHLLRNAIEATPPEGTIRVATMLAQNYAVLTIQDTGRGMAPDVVDKVFVPFYTTKIGGTGLGMVFVRQIMDEHRGVITLESKLGKGTTVTIRLPHRFAESREVEAPFPSPGPSLTEA
jgi:signal transduction histidine kinase